MTKQRNQLQNDLPIESWKEEFSRAKKFKEATQKRNQEKQLRGEVEKLKKKTAIGRLKIEP